MLLAQAIRAHRPDVQCVGFGEQRMENAGFTLWERTTGWATLGPIAAIPQIPRSLLVLFRTLKRLITNPPELIVLVDYGAFNLRLARFLRRLGYIGPILYAFPPSAWRDRPKIAQIVASVCTPLVPFERQAKLYASLELAHHALGHPLPGVILPRPTRAVASSDGGLVALMPGSRKQEVVWILPVMLAAMQILRQKRKDLRVRLIAANPNFYIYLKNRVIEYPWIEVVDGSELSLLDVDAALIKSGTAVLEAALRSVPTVAMYVLSPTLAWIVRNIFHYDGGFVTLPNLVLEREIILERLQKAAIPQTLADDVDRLLADPHTQLADFAELRTRLGGSDVIEQWAHIAVGMLATRETGSRPKERTRPPNLWCCITRAISIIIAGSLTL